MKERYTKAEMALIMTDDADIIRTSNPFGFFGKRVGFDNNDDDDGKVELPKTTFK